MRMLNGLAEKFLYNDQGVLFFIYFFLDWVVQYEQDLNPKSNE